MIGKLFLDNPPSEQQLMAFYREVDHDKTGEASALEFDNTVYRLQMDMWPVLDEIGVTRIIGILNAAADKWHRASGNWYKVFLACDEDNSGSMTFEEMMRVFRKGFPGLSVPPSKVSNQELRGFWNALDSMRSGRVEVYDFLIFMRKYGAEWSMHKSPLEFRKKEALIQDIGPPPERTDDELRHIAQILDDALTGYWNRRGVFVRAVERWKTFLGEADANKDGHLTYKELENTLCVQLKIERNGAFDGPVSAAARQKILDQYRLDGAVVKGVSHDDLYALWCKFDSDRSGLVTHDEWTLGIYRLWLETWPDCSNKVLSQVVDKISETAAKWIGRTKNWYKVFNLVDVDGSGSIGYDEFFNIIRRPLPCLAIPTSAISSDELKGLWKAMDEDRSSTITVQEFMVFMRRLEVKRGISQWRPSAARGSIVDRASTMMELARKAREQPELSPAQEERITAGLQTLTPEHLAIAYAEWEIPWNDTVSDWEWHRIIRELLDIPEDFLDDDRLHAAWSKIDKDNVGQVPVEAVIELGGRT